MEELNLPPSPSGSEPPVVSQGPAWHEAARHAFLRRLMALVAAGTAAFGLTTWTLVRFENPFGSFGAGSDPARVVKAQLDALNRDELRAAYGLFSSHYREQVSFEAYHALVASHRHMFHTRELRFSKQEESAGHAVLETQLVSENGERYAARFTLVRADGRWWIDDLHWRAKRTVRKIITV